MADNALLLSKLEEAIKSHAPKFEVKFKDESKFMKLIDKILFFNKTFMTGYITTIGQKVYWQTRERYEGNKEASFNTLAHEFVHVMDSVNKPVTFTLGYLFPQILAAPGLIFALLLPLWITLMALSIMSPWWLLMLLFLGFLAPIPSPGRKKAEVRGYGMSFLVRMWRYGNVSNWKYERSVDAFTGPNYYWMWPFEKQVRKELDQFKQKEIPPFLENDPNPAWKVVRKVLEENGGLHE